MTTAPASPADDARTTPSRAAETVPLAHHAARQRRGRWVGVPRRGDPRIPFAALLTLFAVTGTLFYGFNRSPLQMLVLVMSGCLLDMALHWLLRGRQLLFPLSSYITCASLTLLLNYSHDLFITFAPVFIAIAFKYVLTLRGRHFFNPSLLAIVVCLLLSGGLITAAPAYQWGGWWYTSPFMLVAALLLVITRVDRLWLVGSFMFWYAVATAVRAYVMRYHVPADVMFVGSMTTPPFFLFTFFMITDPATSPASHRAQRWVGFFIAWVDLYFHTMQSVFTLFYAAFTVALVRFVWGHIAELRRAGSPFARLRDAWSRRWLTSAVVVSALALLAGTAYATVIRPHVRLTDAGFTSERLSAARTGLDFAYSKAIFDEVDPRARRVAKWLLSVGAAGAASDLDGDGRQDLVLTSPVAVAGDRVAVMHNDGGFHFSRSDVPALQRFTDGAPKDVGLASGPLLVDYDNDGDRDLFLMVAFGDTRLLRNDSAPGKITFTDVTSAAHAGVYGVGATANALDYDRDGRVDIIVANILPDHLRGYDHRTRFNVFDLPQPEYDGDRRALRFMHGSWHDARNGGENIVLHQLPGGTFERLDGHTLGMPQTHYSISVGTGDLNRDGWTDIYSASDFGRDDLYINEGGRRFRRVQGEFFDDVGKDTYKGMNSTVADLDRNGWLDVYVSNVHEPLQAEGSLLWINEGVSAGSSDATQTSMTRTWPSPLLRDEATGRGILNEQRFGWGAAATDLDNDGWLDVVQANGMVGNRVDHDAKLDDEGACPDYWYVNHKLMQSGPELYEYADKWGDLRGRCIFANQRVRTYKNVGVDKRPQFIDVADVTNLDARTEGRGVVTADFDDDGSTDVVVTAIHQSPFVYRTHPTRSGSRNAWATVALDAGPRAQPAGASTACTRDALGSQVWVDMPAGAAPQLFEQQAVNGFEAQGDSRIHLGLGRGARAQTRVVVRWCGGEYERFDVARGSASVLRRGDGLAVDGPPADRSDA